MATRYTKTRTTKRTTSAKKPSAHKVRHKRDGMEDVKLKLLMAAHTRYHGVVNMPRDADALMAVLKMCGEMQSDGLVKYAKGRKAWELTALGVAKVLHKLTMQARGRTKPITTATQKITPPWEEARDHVAGGMSEFIGRTAATGVPGARTVNEQLITDLQGEVRLLSYALMWLRNHYAAGIKPGDDREKVVTRADRVLADFPPNVVTGEAFMARYPASKPKMSASAARRLAAERDGK